MSVPRKENPNQYGIYSCLGKGRESEKRWETGKKMCMHGALLGYKNPHRSRAVGAASLPHRLSLSPLKAWESPKPCKHHHAHNPVESSGSACHVVSTLDRGRHRGQDFVLVVVGVLQ